MVPGSSARSAQPRPSARWIIVTNNARRVRQSGTSPGTSLRVSPAPRARCEKRRCGRKVGSAARDCSNEPRSLHHNQTPPPSARGDKTCCPCPTGPRVPAQRAVLQSIARRGCTHCEPLRAPLHLSARSALCAQRVRSLANPLRHIQAAPGVPANAAGRAGRANPTAPLLSHYCRFPRKESAFSALRTINSPRV